MLYRRDGMKPFRKCEEWVISHLLLYHCIDQIDEIDKVDKIGVIDKTDHLPP
jgi:hypothetical protein